jgi:hypothetical protein
MYIFIFEDNKAKITIVQQHSNADSLKESIKFITNRGDECKIKHIYKIEKEFKLEHTYTLVEA